MDSRQSKIHEAQRLRDLGFYNDASVLYEQLAATEPQNCSILLEWAAMNMEQGLIGDCKDKLKILGALLQQKDADGKFAAIYEMLLATVTGVGELKFSGPMETLERIFHEELASRSIEDYDKRAVTITLLYHLLCGLRSMYGFQSDVVVPELGPPVFRELCRHLIKEHRYSEALRVSRLLDRDADDANTASKAGLLKDIYTRTDVPSVVRAETLLEYVEDLLETDAKEEWVQHIEQADDLYRNAGHAYGSLSIRLILLQKRKATIEDAETANEMLQIKKRMEEVGYWTGSIGTLKKYAQFQLDVLGKLEEETLVEIDAELLRYRSICKNNSDWISQTSLNFSRWQLSGANVGKGLEVLERMYNDTADIEAPFLIANTVTKLHEAYLKIGDAEMAASWLSRRPEILPRKMVVVLGLDPFFKSLKEGTDTTDQQPALAALRLEIETALKVVQSNVSLSEKGNEVMRLSHVSSLYIMRWDRRGIENTRALLKPCLDAIHSACQHLDKDQAGLWTTNALQTEARLLFMESHLATDTDSKVELMKECLKIHERTYYMFKDMRRKFDMAMAIQNVALSYDSLWQFHGMPSESDEFTSAAKSYGEAKDIISTTGQMDSQQMIIRTAIQFWFRGLRSNVVVKKWLGFGTANSMDTLMKFIEESERLATIERNDMAALDPERAVLGKQALRKDAAAQTVYDIAIQAYARMNDNENVWNWIQRSKARSVSDMLALGINLPADLSAQVDAHPDSRAQLYQERDLLRRLEVTESTQKIYLMKQVEALRKKMRSDPILKQVLDLREGQPTSLSALRALGKRMASDGRVLFVDWTTINNEICCVIVSESEVKGFPIGVSVQDCTKWKQDYLVPKTREVPEAEGNHAEEETVKPYHAPTAKLDGGQGAAADSEEASGADGTPAEGKEPDGDSQARFTLEYPLLVDHLSPLRELSKFIQPVIQESQKGDLLVFCPGGALHGIPLHAATIDADSDMSLIERNPVVYTSSMTTLEHCVSRQTRPRDKTASFVAVFEETEEGGLEEAEKALRDRIYASVQKIAAKTAQSCMLAGSDATLAAVSQAFSADFVYFFGHCNLDPANMLNQGLLLHPQPDASESPRFTASAMFRTRIRASNVTLMACASASQSHAAGDEPLGITTALLCAGASSITGTMWKVDVDTALAFTDKFHATLAKERRDAQAGVVDLARVVQKTVCRLKKRPETSAPFHWASFLLHGSWVLQK